MPQGILFVIGLILFAVIRDFAEFSYVFALFECCLTKHKNQTL